MWQKIRSKKIKNMPITHRITWIYALIFALTVMTGCVIIMANAYYFSQRKTRGDMDSIANRVEAFILDGGEVTKENIDSFNNNKMIEIRVVNLMERTQVEWMFEPEELPFPWEDVPEDVDKSNPFAQDPTMPSTPGMPSMPSKRFMHMERLVSKGEDIYLIQLFRRMDAERGFMKYLLGLTAIVSIIGLFLSYGVGKYISKTLLDPIDKIRKTAARISIEDLNQRIPVNEDAPDDEIKELAVTFNDMIGRLQVAFDKQNRFVSDASHELRTPLSVIQGYANLIDRWGKNDQAVLQEAIDSIKSETDSMGTLIKRLLFLAKNDQQETPLKMQQINLKEAVQEVLKEISFMEEHIPVTFEQSQNIYIQGDYGLIKQLIWIFIENAYKYANKENCRIQISVYGEQEAACLSVKDNGIGIAQEDLPFIFDRFYRADKSRNKEIPGSGLGLSIAQWIVERHKGTVVVQSRLHKGSEFIVRFKEADNNESY